MQFKKNQFPIQFRKRSKESAGLSLRKSQPELPEKNRKPSDCSRAKNARRKAEGVLSARRDRSNAVSFGSGTITLRLVTGWSGGCIPRRCRAVVHVCCCSGSLCRTTFLFHFFSLSSRC